MAATTTLLGLVTPTQGTLSGTWGDSVNNGITEYVNLAIAGTLSFAGDGAITLANTTGSAAATNIGSTTAQYMMIQITGTLTTTKVITGPSYSKAYIVDNTATGGTVTFKASGQTGISVAVGEKCFVYYNGTDYVKVATSTGTGSVTSVAASVPAFLSVAGSPITTSGTLAITLSGTALPVANGGTNLTSFTSGGVVYASSSSALATGSALTFDGSNLGLGVTPSAWGASIFSGVFEGKQGAFWAPYVGGPDLYTGVNAYYDTGWKYKVSANAASYYRQTAGSHQWAIAPSGTAGSAISFTQAMTLDASGNLLVGTTSVAASNSRLSLAGSVNWGVGPASGGSTFYIYNASNVGVYLTNGANTWASSSDERKKDIIEPITDAANKITQLRAVIGKYKTDAEGTRRSFLIAQDLQSVLPEAVDSSEADSLGVRYTDVIPLLVAAIKEQTTLIQSLKARLDAANL